MEQITHVSSMNERSNILWEGEKKERRERERKSNHRGIRLMWDARSCSLSTYI